MCRRRRDVDLGRMSLCDSFQEVVLSHAERGDAFHKLFSLMLKGEMLSIYSCKSHQAMFSLSAGTRSRAGCCHHFLHCIEGCFLLHLSMFLPVPELSSLCFPLSYIWFSFCLEFELLERARGFKCLSRNLHAFGRLHQPLLLSKENCCVVAIEVCWEDLC